MTDFIDKITKEAEKRLNQFYQTYGDDPPKKDQTDQKAFFGYGPKPKGKIINRSSRPDSNSDSTNTVNLPEEINNQPAELKSEPSILLSSQNEVSFENLSAKQIVSLVKDLTGITIEICIKSKKNIIRHATLILKEKGIQVKSI